MELLSQKIYLLRSEDPNPSLKQSKGDEHTEHRDRDATNQSSHRAAAGNADSQQYFDPAHLSKV
jgi:hypothetical protein